MMDKVWRRFVLGTLLTVLLMMPIGYLIWQSLRLLGYAEPTDAPIVLQYAALIVILVAMRILYYFVADDAYDELQRRRTEKKKQLKSGS